MATATHTVVEAGFSTYIYPSSLAGSVDAIEVTIPRGLTVSEYKRRLYDYATASPENLKALARLADDDIVLTRESTRGLAIALAEAAEWALWESVKDIKPDLDPEKFQGYLA